MAKKTETEQQEAQRRDPVEGPLPESAAVVDTHPLNGGEGKGPLDNVGKGEPKLETPADQAKVDPARDA